MFPLLLLLPLMIRRLPLNVLLLPLPIADGDITWITGTVVLVVVEDGVADSTFNGRAVVEIVMRFGIDVPRCFAGGAIAEAAFAKSDPVRLLKAGTVVNWIAGVDEEILVMVVANGK